MAKPETPNLVMLRDVARRIETLLPRLAFLGGVVVELLVTDSTGRPGRATNDVDVVIDLAHYGQYAETLREELVAIGLEEDTTEGAPRCRWRFVDAPGGSSTSCRPRARCLASRRRGTPMRFGRLSLSRFQADRKFGLSRPPTFSRRS